MGPLGQHSHENCLTYHLLVEAKAWVHFADAEAAVPSEEAETEEAAEPAFCFCQH